jgi:Activator of Hsp90 ATPase, N-terminal
MQWSREKLQELVSDLELALDSNSNVQITGLKDLTGEVRVQAMH